VEAVEGGGRGANDVLKDVGDGIDFCDVRATGSGA